MNLYSLETNRSISVGAIVEFLPSRAGLFIAWVKVLAVCKETGQVQLGSANFGTAWHDPAKIGARIGNKNVARPHGQTKKQAQEEANKVADARENSLAGGRCSSTGLTGDARRQVAAIDFEALELRHIADLQKRGLTPTGRQPSQPEMQELPARDMHGARAGMMQMKVTDVDPAAGSFTIGPTYVFDLDEKANPHSARRQILATGPERDAILAGLRLLQIGLEKPQGLLSDLEDIYTNNDAHLGLTVDEIDALCERLNVGA